MADLASKYLHHCSALSSISSIISSSISISIKQRERKQGSTGGLSSHASSSSPPCHFLPTLPTAFPCRLQVFSSRSKPQWSLIRPKSMALFVNLQSWDMVYHHLYKCASSVGKEISIMHRLSNEILLLDRCHKCRKFDQLNSQHNFHRT